MKIGIIDADLLDNGTRHPNLALMKISGFYKGLGHEVNLIKSYNEDLSTYDKFFMSKVFTFSKVPSEILSLPNLEVGGTGFYEDGGNDLPDEIEHHKPDYTLYTEYVFERISEGRNRANYADYLDYSIGFTTRGCFRKCSFCVNKKYDSTFKHSSVSEFVDIDKPYIYLWDDNFLAYPYWDEILDELEDTGKPFQFRQGLDLRLMTDEKAKRLNSTHYQGDFIFAFDHLSDKDILIEKVQLWKRYSSKVCKMYVLSGYETQDEKNIEDVFERIKILMKYGSLPYIMRHEKYKVSPYRGMYIELARWCNQPQFYKKKSFREFCEANQYYKKNQEIFCSAYQAMIDFENKFPQIAEEFFDLKFEKENIYKDQYGYGRKYANKPNCKNCKDNHTCWDELCGDHINVLRMLKLYLTKEIDIQCLTYENEECSISKEEVANILIKILIETPISTIIELLKASNNREPVTAENIPQFSDIANAIYGVLNVLYQENKVMTYSELGQVLSYGNKNNIADRKYGENQGKLAALLDLAVITKDDHSAIIKSSVMGQAITQLEEDSRNTAIQKLCFRIPIVQNAVLSSDVYNTICKDMVVIAASTRKRRLNNVKTLTDFALNR